MIKAGPKELRFRQVKSLCYVYYQRKPEANRSENGKGKFYAELLQ